MILAAHQPQFMPWLGYFHKMKQCDLFVLLDDVQFKKNEWQNRNRIWSAEGGQWLTVPVLHHFPDMIRDVHINNQADWRDKHRKTLRQAYSQTKHFQEFWEPWDRMYARSWEALVDINLFTIEELRRALGVGTRLELSSALAVPGKSTERLVELCRKAGADTYLAGAGGRDYMEMKLFERAGIRVVFQDFRAPTYPQFGKAFAPQLTALDAVFHLGAEAGNLLSA